MMHAETVVVIKKAGELRNQLTPAQMDTCTSLTIIGKLNSHDISLIRRMGGATDAGVCEGMLRILDLRKAEFVKDNSPYVVLDMAKEHFFGSSLPQFNKSPGDDLSYNLPTHNWGSGSKTVSLKNHVAFHMASYSISDPRCFNDEGKFATESYNHLTVDFTKVSYKKDHRKLRSYNMLKVKGHKIKWENNRFVWYAYLDNDFFSCDMFYGCNQLQAIALPKGMKILDAVKIYQDNKRYYISD